MKRACDSQRAPEALSPTARVRSAAKLGSAFAIAVAVAVLAIAPVAAARDVVRVESVGVAAVRPDATAPRDAAVRRALHDAVLQTARNLLATRIVDEFGDQPETPDAPGGAADEDEELQQILGNDPLEYATRFQVVEDRGEGPVLFGSDLDVETEYVVIVSVFVDRDRIRERLTRAGVLLAPPGQIPEIRSRLILEDLDAYWVYAEIRRVLLEDLKLRSVIPREFTPGRAVLELNASQPPREFLPSLQRSVADWTNLVPLSVEPDELHLRVEVFGTLPAKEALGAGGPIDTGSRNRY